MVGRERNKTNNPRDQRAVKRVPFPSLFNFPSDFIPSQWLKLRVSVPMIALLIQ
jgi:hypothetical protein